MCANIVIYLNRTILGPIGSIGPKADIENLQKPSHIKLANLKYTLVYTYGEDSDYTVAFAQGETY